DLGGRLLGLLGPLARRCFGLEIRLDPARAPATTAATARGLLRWGRRAVAPGGLGVDHHTAAAASHVGCLLPSPTATSRTAARRALAAGGALRRPLPAPVSLPTPGGLALRRRLRSALGGRAVAEGAGDVGLADAGGG